MRTYTVTPGTERTDIISRWQRYRNYSDDVMGKVIGKSGNMFWRYKKAGFSNCSIDAIHKIITFLDMPQEDALRLLTFGCRAIRLPPSDGAKVR